jgi:LPPG:FO 2-phospho-L-lactate transferase
VRVVCLSGGVGGAKLARGLYDVLGSDLTVVANVGDDLEVFGLYVSPDLDSLLYALAGLNDEERGWGRAGETWRALDAAKALGADAWFQLGDLDLGLHLTRTDALRRGEPLSAVTRGLSAASGLTATLLPATDDPLRTHVDTAAGTFAFQDWFVARRHQDEVNELRYEGAERATPAPGVLEAIEEAEAIVFAPSNPYVSLLPILALPAIRDAIAARRVRSVAVSPLIGGRSVKGPLDRMLTRMAGGTTPAHMAACYEGLLDALVIDGADAPAEAPVPLVVTATLMEDRDDSRRLAETVLEVAA